MQQSDERIDRRTVLKATGAALGTAVVGVGAASAGQLRACAVRDPTYVRDYCAGPAIGSVPYNSCGDVYDDCTDSEGNNWFYVDWDDASPNGWCKEAEEIVLYQ